jgi:hypothetical protein
VLLRRVLGVGQTLGLRRLTFVGVRMSYADAMLMADSLGSSEARWAVAHAVGCGRLSLPNCSGAVEQ